MDVVGCDDTMLSDMADREERLRIRELVGRCLTDREAEVIRRRYGLSAACRKPSARWLRPSASAAAMYPAALTVAPGETRFDAENRFCYKKRSTDKNSICPYFGYKKFPASFNICQNIAFFAVKEKSFKFLFKISFLAIAF